MKHGHAQLLVSHGQRECVIILAVRHLKAWVISHKKSTPNAQRPEERRSNPLTFRGKEIDEAVDRGGDSLVIKDPP